MKQVLWHNKMLAHHDQDKDMKLQVYVSSQAIDEDSFVTIINLIVVSYPLSAQKARRVQKIEDGAFGDKNVGYLLA